MGKYLDGGSQEEYDLEIKAAKGFAEAFALWFEEDVFQRDKGYYSIKISYINDNFHSPEMLATIKFFMQFHDYAYMYSKEEQRSVYDDNE